MTVGDSGITVGAGRRAHGLGLATVAGAQTVLEAWFPAPALGPLGAAWAAGENTAGGGDAPGAVGAAGATSGNGAAGGPDPGRTPPNEPTELVQLAGDDPAPGQILPAQLAQLASADPAASTRRVVVEIEIDLDRPPADPADAYLRLHLLSHRLAEPNSINLDGIFGVLQNVVWTSAGPCIPEEFEATRLALSLQTGRPVQVWGVDKFPAMTNYVLPAGVRIADASRVRLGAHLAPGTTVMHEGFINFNAGTLGTAMIEGRVSQGVVIEDGADIGGGASIMGTLSGGGQERIRIGARSLLGANAGVGISLGQDCVVEAGLYLTAGTKVTVMADAAPRLVKARDLSGQSGLLFRRDSATGQVQAWPRAKPTGELNAALHDN